MDSMRHRFWSVHGTMPLNGAPRRDAHGVTLRCAAVAHAHGVELVPHQTQPTVGHIANLHIVASLLQNAKPVEWNDPSSRTHRMFENPPVPVAGSFHIPNGPGLGLLVNEAEINRCRR